MERLISNIRMEGAKYTESKRDELLTERQPTHPQKAELKPPKTKLSIQLWAKIKKN